MITYLLVILISLFASALTFFSGFGLGTILTPFFLIYFPLDTAILMTAIVHLLNNIFKLLLTGKNIDYSLLFKFGIPGIIGGFLGAWCLQLLDSTTIVSWTLINTETNYLNITIGCVMLFFALFDLIPRLKKWRVDQKYIVLGGGLSGFFGGLSGHQGALRSTFLVKTGITKEAFIATGIAIACTIDIARMSVYFTSINVESINISLVTAAVLAAFVGALLGKYLLTKITINAIQTTVGVFIILISLRLIFGLI